MGHNISHEKSRSLDRAARRADLAPYLVPGWVLDVDCLNVVETPDLLGYRARGQTILIRCASADCRRRIEVDLKGAIAAGFGDRRIADLVDLLRCRHWRGCGLKFESATYAHGIPLVSLLTDEDVLIAVSCKRCSTRALLPPRTVIDRLRAAGRGDGATGIRELAGRVRGPCRRCGHRQFESAIVWLGTSS